LRDDPNAEELDMANDDANDIETASGPMNLLGGMKYKIQFNYYHSVQNEKTEDGKAYAYVKWSSDDIVPEIIDGSYLYTESKQPPTKVDQLDQDNMDLGEMIENENCFFE